MKIAVMGSGGVGGYFDDEANRLLGFPLHLTPLSITCFGTIPDDQRIDFED